MRARLSSLVLLFFLVPAALWAQVLPPRTSSSTGTAPFPVTTCVNTVGVGITDQGILTCAPVTPAMTIGLVPSGVDVSAAGQVTSTHLATPLPPNQGGLGITGGSAGGLLYLPTATSYASTPAFPLDAPLFGGGPNNPPVAGTRSGTTRELATILGPHTVGKQLGFDANGNIVASAADIGGSAGGSVLSVFGRQGIVVAQPGDYTAAQVTNAADVTQANLFTAAGGQTMPRLNLSGSVSGTLTLRGPTVAGTSVITFPVGSLDMTATGGPGHVLKQTTAGGALVLAPLDFTELTGTATAAQIPPLQSLLGIVPLGKGGLGWTDTTLTGTTHILPTVAGTLTSGACLTADAQHNIISTGLPCGSGGSSGAIQPGTAGILAYYPSTGTTVGQSGIVAGEVLTAATAFPAAGRVLQSATTARGVSETSVLVANLCTTTSICSGYQAALGFTAENVANKDPASSITTSNTTYPTSGAVNAYVTAGLATKQTTLGFTPENVANKSDTTGLGTSVTLYPTQRAVKDYVDTHVLSDAQIPDLNTLSSGLGSSRCVETDATGKLGVAAGACGLAGGSTGISGATNHGLMVATGGTTGSSLAVATNGQLPIGSTGADPVLATLTGTANQIAVTNGPGAITLAIPTNPTLPGTTTGSFSGPLAGNATTASGLSAILGCAQHPALTGDVTTSSGSCATTIGNNSVTLAKMATMATASFLGRTTAGVGNPEVLSVTQAKTLLALEQVTNDAQLKRSANDFSTFPSKAVPVSGDILLLEDSAAAGVKKAMTVGALLALSSVTDGDKGDITVSASGATWTIDAGTVTYAKMQATSSASVLLGRGSISAGAVQEITLGSGLTMTGTTLSASGGGNVSNTGTPVDNQLAVWTSATQLEGTTQLTYNAGTLGLGAVGAGGKIALAGNTSGVVTLQPQSTAGTYNFNLPTTAGISGQVLASGGGVAAPMTWITLATSATTDTTNATNITSGTLACARLAALTGDVTTSAGSCATTVANLPSAVPAAGSILMTAIAAPATPASGKGLLYLDSTAKNLMLKNDAGGVLHGVQTRTGTPNQFLTNIDDAGNVGSAQPSFANLSGSATCAQLPALTGDVTTPSGSCASTIANNAVTLAKLGTMATASLLGRSTAGTGNVEVLSASAAKAMLALDQVDNKSEATIFSDTGILTNKQITPRVIQLSGGTCTGAGCTGTISAPNADNGDIWYHYLITGGITIPNPSATGSNPVHGQIITFMLKSATPQTVSFGANYSNENGIELLSSTTGNGSTYDQVAFRYNSTSLKWGAIATTKPARGVTALASSTTYTCPGDISSVCEMQATMAAGTITVAAPTGTPYNGQQLRLRFLCTNAQTFSWNAIFVNSPNVTAPTTCPASTTIWNVVGAEYFSSTSKWQILAVN